jgi:phytoene dehydrogenase-like protein
MPKTKDEKIANIQEQIVQLENQKKRLVQQQKEEQRKARTRRLIERGAMLEKRIDGADALTNEQIGYFLDKTLLTPFSKRILAETTARGAEPVSASTEPGGGGAGAPPSGASTARAAV